MPRRYKKTIYRNKDKYSVEHTVIVTPVSSAWTEVAASGTTQASRQYSIAILPPTDLEGMRKIKHITFTISNVNSASEGTALLYAIVYVPEGYEPQALNFPMEGSAIELYSANQFVLSSGVLDFSGGPLRIRSPLSRNLNSGDSIYLVLALPDSFSANIYTAEVKYAITLQ